MPLVLRQFDQPAHFAEAVMSFLLEREVEHVLPIGILAQCIAGDLPVSEYVSFVSVESGGRPVAVGIRTPPFNPIISQIEDDNAIPLLVEFFREQADLRGVLASNHVATAFAAEWTRQTGTPHQIEMEERIYELRKVIPANAPGSARIATEADFPLLLDWFHDFVREAFGAETSNEHAERSVRGRLRGEQSGFVIWEDGQPVSIAGWSGPTPNGIRIGPVYTPEEFRRRGYGAAVTSTVCQYLLGEGRLFCALFTDLANPTSNRIYQQIGFRPVIDMQVYRFS